MDLSSFLSSSNLSHLADTFAGKSHQSLEAQLGERGRAAFLNDLKTLGVTALKDRQGLTNALAKLKRERDAGPPPVLASEKRFNPKGLKKYEGPNDDCDFFGRRRGAHASPGVCVQFMRAEGKNENDMEGFNCYCCGEPPGDHADLGPAPLVPEEEDDNA